MKTKYLWGIGSKNKTCSLCGWEPKTKAVMCIPLAFAGSWACSKCQKRHKRKKSLNNKVDDL